mmetsp:Transcript_30955/g.81017  ORF Transcript_30955/g.81017 Transcript_30955/m.81017 type:complete len:99 (-) Transcript_30955:41-337(-)
MVSGQRPELIYFLRRQIPPDNTKKSFDVAWVQICRHAEAATAVHPPGEEPSNNHLLGLPVVPQSDSVHQWVVQLRFREVANDDLSYVPLPHPTQLDCS